MRNEPVTLQLQLWDAKARTYIPAAPDAPRGRAWRICKPYRPVKNPRYTPPRYRGGSRDIESVQAQYLVWAAGCGVSPVTAYESRRPLPHSGMAAYHGRINYVDAAAYFSVTVETDNGDADA